MTKKTQPTLAHDVIEEFECKLTGQYFRIGSIYVGDSDRIKFLTEAGFLSDLPTTTGGSQLTEVTDNGDAEKNENSTKDKPK